MFPATVPVVKPSHNPTASVGMSQLLEGLGSEVCRFGRTRRSRRRSSWRTGRFLGRR